jgi:hypothetical protein
MLIQFLPTKVQIKIGTDKENCKKTHSFMAFYRYIEEKCRFLAKSNISKSSVWLSRKKALPLQPKCENRVKRLNQ